MVVVIIKQLYEYINYDAGINTLVSSYIREYDISKANINVLYKYGVIDQETYNRCLCMEKLEREIFIGKLQKQNPKSVEVLQKGIIEAKRRLFLANNIKPEEVLCIKNDAVFLINKILKETKFDNIEFLHKNTYSSYMKIDKIEFYYYLNIMDRKEVLDIKGISQNIQNYHQNYLIGFIKDIFGTLQTFGSTNAIRKFNKFMNNYLNLRMDLGYYMDLDKRCYKIKKLSNYMDNLYVESLAEKDKIYIDYSYNLHILNAIGSNITNLILNGNGSTF